MNSYKRSNILISFWIHKLWEIAIIKRSLNEHEISVLLYFRTSKAFRILEKASQMHKHVLILYKYKYILNGKYKFLM